MGINSRKTAGGGASNLDGLSDVSYSSGDLTITSLDLLTTSATVEAAAGQAITIQGGATTAGTTNNLAGGNLVLKGGAGKGSGVGGIIEFQTIPAGSSGSTLNTTTVTPMSISTTEVVVNEASSSAVDLRVESDSLTHFLFVDSSLDRMSVGSSINNPGATLEVEATTSGDSIPVLKLKNSRVSANVLEIDASTSTTTGDCLKINAGALTTGRGLYVINSNSHNGVRDVALIEQSSANADNATALRVKQDGSQPAISMEFDGASTSKAPLLEFLRSSTSSEEDGMDLGTIQFNGSDSANNIDTYASIFCETEDVTTTEEDGLLNISTIIAGTLTTQIALSSTGTKIPSQLTMGAGAAADVLIKFDGNAQDYRLGIDDGTDTLELGHGAVMGTNTALSVNSSGQIASLSLGVDAVAVASDHIMFLDGGATGAPKVESITDLVTAIAGTGLGLKPINGTLSNNRCSSTVTDDNLTLTAIHNGHTIIVKEMGADKTLTLPALQAGYAVKVLFLHNQNTSYSYAVQAAADTNYIYGLISRIAWQGGASTAWDNAPESYAGETADTFPGGTAVDAYNTITLTKMIAGSFINLYCDGTYWYVDGILQSANGTSVEATVAFSAEDY